MFAECCDVCNVIRVIAWFFFFQAEDGIRDLVRSRGLGDVYKRQQVDRTATGDWRGRRVVVGDKQLEPPGIGAVQRDDLPLSLIHI